MLGVPATTEFDLRFRLLGIPVRVHPFFWVLAALLGWAGRDFFEILIWVACVFVSILVHEFGHALAARALVRQNPLVVLYAMGGLCVYDSEDRRPWRRVGILLAGPGAGFLLYLVAAIFGVVVLGLLPFPVPLNSINAFVHQPPRWVTVSMLEAYRNLTMINLVWGIFNLMPIFPLDGGQILHTFLARNDRREGPRRCYIVSMGFAALIAVYLFQRDQTYNALLVAYLGLMNFQYFQATQFQARAAGGDDDNWWRR